MADTAFAFSFPQAFLVGIRATPQTSSSPASEASLTYFSPINTPAAKLAINKAFTVILAVVLHTRQGEISIEERAASRTFSMNLSLALAGARITPRLHVLQSLVRQAVFIPVSIASANLPTIYSRTRAAVEASRVVEESNASRKEAELADERDEQEGSESWPSSSGDDGSSDEAGAESSSDKGNDVSSSYKRLPPLLPSDIVHLLGQLLSCINAGIPAFYSFDFRRVTKSSALVRQSFSHAPFLLRSARVAQTNLYLL
jgi:hypothetical protein